MSYKDSAMYEAMSVSRGVENPECVFYGLHSLEETVFALYGYLVLKVIQLVTLTSGFPDWCRHVSWCSYQQGWKRNQNEEAYRFSGIAAWLPLDFRLKYPDARRGEEGPPPCDWIDKAPYMAMVNVVGFDGLQNQDYTSVGQPKALPVPVSVT